MRCTTPVLLLQRLVNISAIISNPLSTISDAITISTMPIVLNVSATSSQPSHDAQGVVARRPNGASVVVPHDHAE